MPQIGIHNFTELHEFTAALRESKVDLTILEPGRCFAGIMDVNLGSLNIRRISETLPRIIQWSDVGEYATFVFHTRSGQSVIHNGRELKPDNIVLTGRPTSHCQRSFGPVNWGSISLPLADVPDLGQPLAQVDLAPSANGQMRVAPPAALAEFQRLHAAVVPLARGTPELIENPNVARGLEQNLKQALGACLDDSDSLEQTRPRHHRMGHNHHMIMRRYHAFLEANDGQAVYVLEMAKAVGASVRSLTACCHEYLGMGPKRYLALRRMHLVWRALQMANPSTVTVTDVATQYGFWQFGRFAGQYKSLFGELPSDTLRGNQVNESRAFESLNWVEVQGENSDAW